MKISGLKYALQAVIILSIVMLGAVLAEVINCDDIPRYLPQIILLLLFWLCVSFMLLKEWLTYYTLDEKGITEHFLSRSRTFLWSECRFINQIGVQSYAVRIKTIICSKSGLPYEISDKKIGSYRWPKKETMCIRNRDDEIYREFLIWCGGERDIRE